MLPYCLGTTKIRSTAVTKNAPYVYNGTDSFLCIRCSRNTLKASNNPAVICTKGHVQCRECDTVMRHQCRRCGILTTEGLQHDKRMKNIDPRTMSPEELTQLELNSALNQFKSIFIKKKKKKKIKLSRLNESTCRIIEILNPNLILLYKQCGLMKRKKIEEHFFRTSEKFEHSFEWHKAALEFVMERLIDLNFYSRLYEMVPNVQLQCKKNIDTSTLEKNLDLDFLEKCNNNASTTQHRTECKQLKKKEAYQLENINRQQQQLDAFEPKSHMINDMPMIFVKPTKWLTEVLCPHCGLSLRLSDFSKHFAFYHCLPIECMNVNESKQICLDPKVLLNRSSYPHTLFLVNNCVRNLGGSDFRNFYPIVLITATICMSDFHVNVKMPKCRERDCEHEHERKHLMLWLSGITFNDQIQICLKVISMQSMDTQQCLILNKLYPITRSQHLKDIRESESMIMLSPETLRAITNNGTKSIILEINVHIQNTSNLVVQ